MTLKAQTGFTLVELLVVIAIIGILAAIAIPQFASYRSQAFCSRVESDVKNTVVTLEAEYARTQDYTGVTPVQSQGVAVVVDATASTINTVKGNHASCRGGVDFTFTGSTGNYAWP